MSELFGLPAHPLIVHLPVVLIPLAALGLVAIAIRPAWGRSLFGWVVLGLSFLGMLGAIIAASTGEELEEMIERAEGREGLAQLHDHVEAGELARTLSIVFFVVALIVVLLPRWIERRRSATVSWVRPVVIGLAVLASVAAVGSVVNAGHSGATSVWCELNDSC